MSTNGEPGPTRGFTVVLSVAAVVLVLSGCTPTHRAAHHESGRFTSAPPTLAASTTIAAPTTHPATTTLSASTATTAPTPSSSPSPPGTSRIVVRPVTRSGLPVHGYSVVRDEGDHVLCTDGPSPVAVDPNIRFCGSSAMDTVACWKSAVASTILCLRDPLTHTLVRLPVELEFAPTAAPAHPVPQALVLDNGSRCLIRDGGAWSAVPGHPSWVGAYSCSGSTFVYGPRGGDGIDEKTHNWTVHMVTLHKAGAAPTIETHSVRSAYYVGTA